MDPKNLKLIARTEEDLRVVSAHLQDSIASVADIANLKKNKIFLMQLNRFPANLKMRFQYILRLDFEEKSHMQFVLMEVKPPAVRLFFPV